MTGELLPEGEAALSHDVRNSMAALRVIVEGLRDGVVKATPESGIPDQMMLHIRLLSDLLDDHSHLGEARQGAAGVGPVRIGCFLEQWSEAMRPKARQRRVDLRLVVAPSLPDIECRAGQVARVLLNLIDNAIRHTPAGGSVIVRAVVHPGAVQNQGQRRRTGHLRSHAGDPPRPAVARSSPRGRDGGRLSNRGKTANKSSINAG